MNLTIETSVPLITVFLQGLLSFFSPCVLPLLPVYIGYLSGGTAGRDEEGRAYYDRRKVLLNTMFFVVGIAFAFFVLGLGLRAVGRFFSGNQLLFARIGGIIVILFGLYQLGVFGEADVMNQERRLPVRLDRMAMSPLTACLMGFVFSFAWTPCVGPTLSSVLLMAASAENSAAGFGLIWVYTAGFVIPFLLTGIFTTSLLGLFRRHRNVVKYTRRIGGALLILMGILMLTGQMSRLSGYFSRLSGQSTEVVSEEQLSGESNEETEPEPASETVTEEETVTETETETEVTTEAETETETEVTTEAETETETEVATEAETAATEDESEDGTEAAARSVIPAPDFTLTDQYGVTHTLSDYQGKIVFLNFWATWCPPCRAEMPDIQKLYEENLADEDSDLVILGVAFPNLGDETSVEGITAFLEENGYTYPVVMDTEASLMLPYYITAYPTTFMIDQEGNLFGYVPGSMTREIMDSIIAQTREGTNN